MAKSAYTNWPKPYRVLLHLILWLVFIQVLFDIGGLYYSAQVLVSSGAREVDDAFIAIPVLVTLFYGNSLWLAPRFLKKGSWLKYILGLLVSYAMAVVISYGLFVWVEESGGTFEIDRHEFLDGALVIYPIVLMASLSWSVTKMAYYNSEQEKLARKGQQEAELKVLTSQFNPHFLFNTLNGLYALSSSEKATQTTEAILKLSEIMRYPINKGDDKSVALIEEVKFIEDYIDLQRIRLGDDYPVSFEKSDSLEGIEIIPLCLMPLVENAFKYGVSQRYKTPISLKIKIADEHLYFTVSNQIVQEKHEPSFQSGIKNLKSRLEIVYPNQCELLLDKSENDFTASLKISLQMLRTND